MIFSHHVINYRLIKTYYLSAALVVGCVNALDKQTASESHRLKSSGAGRGASVEEEVETKPSNMRITSVEPEEVFTPERLQLYYHPYSYYSQKVLMAFHEKDLPFDGIIVDLFKGEHQKSWFLALNSKGEVPVLKDSIKIIPDSERIIDYIEDNFSNGRPRLVPMNEGAELRHKVNNFRHRISSIPAGVLTTGAVLNPRLIKNAKIPFSIFLIRNALANDAKNAAKHLRQAAEENPHVKKELLEKAAKSEENYQAMSDEINFESVLNAIDHVLLKVEDELKSHEIDADKQDWWLCSKQFTIADIELTILLERISQLGLEYYFWSDGNKPYIEKYYERVKTRSSYKKSIPGTMSFFKTILISQAPIIISVVTAVALIVGGAFIAKKYIS